MGFKSRVSSLVCFYFLTNASSTYENNTKGKGLEYGRSKEDCADLVADVDPNFPDYQAKNEKLGSGSSSNSTLSQGADYNDASVKNLRRQKSPKHKRCKKTQKSLKHKRCKKTQNTKWHSARSFKKRNNRREFRIRRSQKGTRKLKKKKPRSQRQFSTGSMKRRTNKKQVHPLWKVISKRGQYRSIKHVFIRNCLYNSEAY